MKTFVETIMTLQPIKTCNAAKAVLIGKFVANNV